MKPVPLYVVRHFNGEATRTISKHLFPEAAFQMANRFVHNLKDKRNRDPGAGVLVAITQLSGSDDKQTILSLTTRDHGPLQEGVTITLEAQKNPYWIYPQYTDPRESDGGHVTTAERHVTVDEHCV